MLLGLVRVFLAEKAVEDVEALGPEALVEAQPLVRAGERAGAEPAPVRAAAYLAPDQSGGFKCLDVFGGRGQRHGMGRGELGDRSLAAREFPQHGPPGGVPKRVECGIKDAMFNHKVEYSGSELIVNRIVEPWPVRSYCAEGGPRVSKGRMRGSPVPISGT